MKTTLAGLAGAALLVLQAHLQSGKDLTDWKTYLGPLAIALLGFLAKDFNKTGK